MSTDDSFHLQRFVDAQADGVYEQALAKLRAGEKRSDWMWFIFPQSAELGRSPTAKYYGLSGEEEARAYLAHPVLGPRYRTSVAAVRAQVMLARARGDLSPAGRDEIQIAGERISVPVRATFNIEHERGDDEEEIEFQIKWRE
jgi:hypothetical protein